jgi:hypothetical protein
MSINTRPKRTFPLGKVGEILRFPVLGRVRRAPLWGRSEDLSERSVSRRLWGLQTP